MASSLPSSSAAWALASALCGLLVACRSPEIRSLKPVARVQTAGGFISHMDLSANGANLLAADDTHRVSVWRAPRDGAPPSFILQLSERALQVEFIGLDRLFAAAMDGRVLELDSASGQTEFQHQFDGRGLSARSADGRYYSYDRELFDRTLGREAAPAPVSPEVCVQFSADGTRLLSVGRHPSLVSVRDLRTGQTHRYVSSEEIRSATLSPPGEFVVASLRGGVVRAFRLPDFQPVSSFWGAPDPLALSFLDDGQRVVVVSARNVAVHELKTTWKTLQFAIPARASAVALRSNVLAVGTEQGELWVWDLRSGEPLARAQVGSSALSAVAIAPAARRVAAGDEHGQLTVFQW